jgi:hypothetical protein
LLDEMADTVAEIGLFLIFQHLRIGQHAGLGERLGGAAQICPLMILSERGDGCSAGAAVQCRTA